MQSAAKVGLLLVVFVGLLLGAYAVIGKSLFAPALDSYAADFPDAGGVTVGTPVLIAGVQVGTVTKVTLLSPRQARLAIGLNKGTPVPEGSTVVIPTALIGLGSQPLQIVPPERVTGVNVPPGTILAGRKAGALDAVLPDSKETVREFTRTLTAVRKLLEDQKLRNRANELLLTSNKTIERFGKLANDANFTLNQNQANISRAVAAATNAMQDVRRVTYQVAQLAERGDLQKDAVAILDRTRQIAENADKVVISLNKLINDPSLRGPASQSAANIAEITKTGTKIAENTEQITRNGIEISKNGIEISKNVSTISAKAITLTDQANEIAKNAIEIEQQLKGVLERVGGFFGTRPKGAGGLSRLSTQLDLMRQTDPGYWRTDISFNYPLADSTLHLGLFDAFETNRLTVQLGKPVTNSFSYRYGIYASKPGIGVDYRLAPRLSLRGDAWDINNPRLDLRASYDFGNGLIGWFGMDRVFNRNAPTIGIGIRR